MKKEFYSPIAKPHYKRLFISDVHLGSRWSRGESLMNFLNSVTFDELYIVGDLVDYWALSRNSLKKWNVKHFAALKKILDIAKNGTPVYYIVGNHDEKIGKVIGDRNPNFTICNSDSYLQKNRKVHILHGHKCCSFSKTRKALSWIMKRFLPRSLRRYSINADINLSDFEREITKEAKRNDASVVICGHVHCADMRKVNNVLYINTGDWISNNTAVAEKTNGKFVILRYGFTKSVSTIYSEELPDYGRVRTFLYERQPLLVVPRERLLSALQNENV